ncbi:UNVERIFIED_CONTAM: Transposon Ty3-G Gag-Pol polyprotein [Sesamum radiatum]|uniref:Transposon Ty3-G Gag-Pol polyprotein n=1 Tax=Sesamum radiatum TaxID=300843 RepID=A0AAW2KA16_SESRA
MKKVMYWKGLKQDVFHFVKDCLTCQMHKLENVASRGLLQPLPIPERIWEDISMDFISGLPPSLGKDTVLVVVNRLSKYAHFIALKHSYSAASVAQLFLDNVFKLHGRPKSIVVIMIPSL